MKSSVTVALFVLLLLSMGSSVALSQDDAEPTQQQDPAMQAWIDLMTPGEHHQWLAQRVGKWDVATSYWTAPGAPPVEGLLHASYEMVLGGRYLSHKVDEMDWGGMPFGGYGFIGFDNSQKVFVSAWIDSFGTGIATGRGTRDTVTTSNSDSVLDWTYTYTSTDPISGQENQSRSTEEEISADEFVVTYFKTMPDGTEMKEMVQHHTRKKQSSNKQLVFFAMIFVVLCTFLGKKK